ncbi:MAG: hypothetical protein ACJAZM_002089 [Cyclobacteriaceae bacterium]|jgi:uncharacterized protein YbcC (UPF0753/DUF2309 family)
MNSTNSGNNHFNTLSAKHEALLTTMRQTCKKIAPLWSLDNFVAVNPYLGHTGKKFEDVAQELALAGGIHTTLPYEFYIQKYQEGIISPADLASALNKQNSKIDAAEFIKTIQSRNSKIEKPLTVPSVANIATLVTKKDWNRFVTSRISSWAASYFDAGQAVWSASDQSKGIYAAWKAEAEIDLTPGLTGLKGFRRIIKTHPDNPIEATQVALEKLGIPLEKVPTYLHRILINVGGWSAYAARLDWENELYGGHDGKLIEFLAVLCSWEACLLESINNDAVNTKWHEAKEFFNDEAQFSINKELANKLILQEAFDIAAQRSLLRKFKKQEPIKNKEIKSVQAQAVFCIDVRSEVYRRNLETINNDIETLGFAGFFAFPIKYVPLGQEVGEAQCPVLLKTGPTILEEVDASGSTLAVHDRRIQNNQVQQLWKSFKSGAVTCFSFVSPIGLSYLPKLFTDSFGMTRPVPDPNKNGLSSDDLKKLTVSLSSNTFKNEKTGIELEEQIQMASNALTAMSLGDNLAPMVLIVGHGSTMVNNPHATGYDCGACGGHSGEANARVAAAVLNNPAVRQGLQKENIFIPEKTVFLACLHDTTTDEVTIFNEQDLLENSVEELTELKNSLALAGVKTRQERALRMPNDHGSNVSKSMITRSKDWSQTRPEWGLAGCSAFVVAPRNRTKGIDLQGQSFLHSYEWEKDQEFSVLELIMTAPMVVTSWINLQYYGSTVDNKNLGSGNKTLHNVTAGIGVIEGFSGDLRVGLPHQAIHDGKNYQHDPLRLSVIIEAPIEAMNAILKKNTAVQDLCDNGWLYLFAMNDGGEISHRYSGSRSWEEIEPLVA